METNQPSKQANKKQMKRQTEKGRIKGKSFENRFRSGGEENERQMVNNVMQEMRVL